MRFYTGSKEWTRIALDRYLHKYLHDKDSTVYTEKIRMFAGYLRLAAFMVYQKGQNHR